MANCPKCGSRAQGDPPICGNEVCPDFGKPVAKAENLEERAQSQSRYLRDADMLVVGGVTMLGLGSEFRENFHPAIGVLLPVAGAAMVLVGWILLRRRASALINEITALRE